jgi:hypothetical protein
VVSAQIAGLNNGALDDKIRLKSKKIEKLFGVKKIYTIFALAFEQ